MCDGTYEFQYRCNAADEIYHGGFGAVVLGIGLVWIDTRHACRRYDLPPRSGVLPHEVNRKLRPIDNSLVVNIRT